MADPTGGGNVDVLIAIQTSGQDQARAAKQAIDDLNTPTAGASSKVEQLGQAFERLERREPTMLIRRSAFALESMAASAIGAEGPLGRLAGTFALFMGPEGAVVLGAIAAIGGAIELMGTHARDAAADVARVRGEIEKLNTEGAKLGATAQLFGTGEKTGFFHLLVGGEEKGRGLLEIQTEQQAALTKFTQQMIKSFGSVEAAPQALRDRFQELYTQLKATTDLVDVLRTKLAELHGQESEAGHPFSVREYKEETAYEELIARRRQPLAAQVPIERFAPLLRAPRVRFAEQEGPGRTVEEFRQRGLEPGMGAERHFSAAAAIGAGFGIAGQAAQGDVGGTISGIGALAATVPGGQIPGAVVSGLGALVSLFGSHKPKVTIDAYSAQAMQQMREVRGDPATTSFTILGSTGQGTAYDLARLAARGIVPRFPGTR